MLLTSCRFIVVSPWCVHSWGFLSALSRRLSLLPLDSHHHTQCGNKKLALKSMSAFESLLHVDTSPDNWIVMRFCQNESLVLLHHWSLPSFWLVSTDWYGKVQHGSVHYRIIQVIQDSISTTNWTVSGPVGWNPKASCWIILVWRQTWHTSMFHVWQKEGHFSVLQSTDCLIALTPP